MDLDSRLPEFGIGPTRQQNMPTRSMLVVFPFVATLVGCLSQPATPANMTIPSAAITHLESSPQVIVPATLDASARQQLDDLIVAMYIDDISIRRDAAEKLGSMGADAREALPELIRCTAAKDKKEPRQACAHAIVAIASGHAPAAMGALLAAFRLPLSEKEAALPIIGELGGLATPALATLYIDACERMQTVTNQAAHNHLATTRQLTLGQLAKAAASAIAYFERDENGVCGQQGADALRT